MARLNRGSSLGTYLVSYRRMRIDEDDRRAADLPSRSCQEPLAQGENDISLSRDSPQNEGEIHPGDGHHWVLFVTSMVLFGQLRHLLMSVLKE
jgi:hypothetical protein